MYQRILRQSDYRYGFFLLSESHRCGRLLSRSDLNNSPEKLKNCPKSTQKNDINRLRLPKAPLFAGLARRPHPRHTAGRAERAERSARRRGAQELPRVRGDHDRLLHEALLTSEDVRAGRRTLHAEGQRSVEPNRTCWVEEVMVVMGELGMMREYRVPWGPKQALDIY